jgi:hypothetical protein
MEKKIYELLNRNSNCVLLHRIEGSQYKVMDIEGDTIYMGFDPDRAFEVFDSYDINKIRKEKEKNFEHWLTRFARPFK